MLYFGPYKQVATPLGPVWSLPDGARRALDLRPNALQFSADPSTEFDVMNRAIFVSDTPISEPGVELLESEPSLVAPITQHHRNLLSNYGELQGKTLLDALFNLVFFQLDPTGTDTAPRGLPTAALNNQLALESLFSRRSSPVDPVFERVQEQFLEVEASGATETELGQFYGMQVKKYRIPEDQAFKLLPAPMRGQISLLEPSTTIVDDFNRPDEILSSPWVDCTTGVGGCRWDVVNQEVKKTSSANEHQGIGYALIFPTNDLQAQVKYVRSGSHGPMTRKSLNATRLDGCAVYFFGATLYLRQYANSVITEIANGPVTEVLGAELRIVSDGITHEAYHNGQLELFGSTTGLSGYNSTGMFAYNNQPAALGQLDDFMAQDIQPPEITDAARLVNGGLVNTGRVNVSLAQ